LATINALEPGIKHNNNAISIKYVLQFVAHKQIKSLEAETEQNTVTDNRLVLHVRVLHSPKLIKHSKTFWHKV